MNSSTLFIRPSPSNKGHFLFQTGLCAIVVSGAALLALDWYTQPPPAENRAQTLAATSSTQAQPPTSRSGAQAAVADPDCAVVSPYANRDQRCSHAIQVLPDAHAETDLLDADIRAQTRELSIQSDMAVDVLRLRPGASLVAYKAAGGCDAESLPAGITRNDCGDLRKVMPFVLMDLEFNAITRRDSEAAIAMAQHHVGMLERVPSSVRVYHLKQAEQYLAIVGGAFPDDVRELQRRMEEAQQSLFTG